MAKSKKKSFFKLMKSGRKAKKQREVGYLLEVGTLESMRAAKKRTEDLLEYHWSYYSELAKQRNQKIEEIKKSLGQQDGQHSGLTPQELALTNPQSQTIVSVSGQLDKIFDLRSASHLKKLIFILKHFKISKDLVKKAKELNLDAPGRLTAQECITIISCTMI